jgi:uncharacterized protein (DUF302 family)
MKLFKFAMIWLLLASSSVHAENMIMLRTSLNFDEGMIMIKDKLEEYGYKIAHIQKCDGGLGDAGYKTGLYKSVFFGKFDEMRYLTAKYPQIIPYVPLKIAIMEELDTLVLVSLNPSTLKEFFEEPELRTLFGRWESDVRAIFEEISNSKKL